MEILVGPIPECMAGRQAAIKLNTCFRLRFFVICIIFVEIEIQNMCGCGDVAVAVCVCDSFRKDMWLLCEA